MADATDSTGQAHCKGTDFVFYTVDDISAGVQFYRDTLGLSLELHNEEAGWAEFAAPPTTFAIGEENDRMPFTPGADSAGIAFAVDDLTATAERLRDDGVPVRMEPVESQVCQMVVIEDPAGNGVVLHERNDGTHGRRDPFPE